MEFVQAELSGTEWGGGVSPPWYSFFIAGSYHGGETPPPLLTHLWTSIAFGEGGVEEVVAAVDEVVECRGAEYEEALQHEIPQHGHYDGCYDSGDGEADVVNHVERVEERTLVEEIGEVLRAECVEQQASEPYEEKLDAYREIRALAHAERELIVNQAVHYTSRSGANHCGYTCGERNKCIEYKADDEIGIGRDLRCNDRTQEHEYAPALQ